MTETLPQYLRREGTVAIADIDTRQLTRMLRTSGAQNGCILTLPAGAVLADEDVAQASPKRRPRRRWRAWTSPRS